MYVGNNIFSYPLDFFNDKLQNQMLNNKPLSMYDYKQCTVIVFHTSLLITSMSMWHLKYQLLNSVLSISELRITSWITMHSYGTIVVTSIEKDSIEGKFLTCLYNATLSIAPRIMRIQLVPLLCLNRIPANSLGG